jgi:FkbM family methyltransferase
MERKNLSLKELDEIPYFDEKGGRILSEYIEREEQKDAEKLIPAHAIVLELGGRYGLAAAVINHRLHNPKQHIVVEPDPAVQQALERNRTSHHCEYTIIQGVVSRRPLYFYAFGFSSFCSEVPNDHPVPTLTLEELQQRYGIPNFTHLVADCEGGLMDFFEENKQFFETLEGIYFEGDTKNGMKVNYQPLKTFLQEHGFVAKKTGFREYWERVKLGSDIAEYCQVHATNSS